MRTPPPPSLPSVVHRCPALHVNQSINQSSIHGDVDPTAAVPPCTLQPCGYQEGGDQEGTRGAYLARLGHIVDDVAPVERGEEEAVRSVASVACGGDAALTACRCMRACGLVDRDAAYRDAAFASALAFSRAGKVSAGWWWWCGVLVTVVSGFDTYI